MLFSLKVRFFLERLRYLPTKFWVVLTALFGIADFLTWSVLANIAPSERIYWTLGIAFIGLVITIIVIVRTPSIDEKMVEARSLYRVARDTYEVKDYAKTRNLLIRAAELDPQRVSTWSLLSKTNRRLGNYHEAIEAATMAINLTQESKPTYLHIRGMTYAMMHEYGRALGY